jgi:glucosamine-6-phosphate deaminase
MRFQVDELKVEVFPDRAAMGAAAAVTAAAEMRRVLAAQPVLRMSFAAAPSQNEFLAGLAAAEGIDWSRVVAFQLDEYVGLPDGHPARFGSFLHERIWNKVKPGTIHAIGVAGTNPEAEAESRRYADLLAEAPVDLVLLGIGENGHLAFNDPPVADFNDPLLVKVVELDEACRQQQVNDGCFPSFDDVPTHAITQTIPALLAGKRLVAVVPGPAKRIAVTRTLNGPIETACPGSILRTHPNCTLYLDEASYGGADGSGGSPG